MVCTEVVVKREHRVQIKLRTKSIWDIESRVNEVGEIRDWIREQCGWDPDSYEVKFRSMDSILDVWFEHEEDAVMCTLRWL